MSNKKYDRWVKSLRAKYQCVRRTTLCLDGRGDVPGALVGADDGDNAVFFPFPG